VIRIASFFLLVAGLALHSLAIFIIAIPIIFLLLKAGCTFLSLILLLKRLRWLFLSLLILHLWFNTGQLVWIPKISNIFIAIERVSGLIIIVLAAHLLVKTTSIQAIIAALQWWLMPLKVIGFSAEKLTVRLALVLDTVQSVQEIQAQTHITDTKNPIKKITNKVSTLFMQVFEQAENTPLKKLTIPTLSMPPLWQWVYPLILLILINFQP